MEGLRLPPDESPGVSETGDGTIVSRVGHALHAPPDGHPGALARARFADHVVPKQVADVGQVGGQWAGGRQMLSRLLQAGSGTIILQHSQEREWLGWGLSIKE